LSLRGGDGDASQQQLAVPYEGEIKELLHGMQSIDNEARTASEQRFNLLKTDSPDVTMSGLVQELVSSPSEEVRSMAAVLARGQITEVWTRLTPNTQENMKTQLLGLLQNYRSPETGNAFGRKLANVIGALSWFSEGGWPSLLPTVIGMCESQALGTQELGFEVLSLVVHHSFVHSALQDQLPQLQTLFEQSLANQDGNVQLAGMKAIGAYVAACESPKQARSMQGLVSPMLKALGEALQVDEERARSGLDVLIEMTDVNPKFFKPQLKEITNAMLQHVAMNLALEASTRRLALEFLVELCERAPSMMKKEEGFIQQLVAVSFAFMVEGTEANKDMDAWERWEDDDEDEEETGNYVLGLEALDRLANSCGGPRIVPACFAYIPDFLANQQDWRYRLVGLYGISQTGEGAAKEMRKHLPNIVSLVLPMVADPHPRVRWAAVNCIGQLATDLGPHLQRGFHEQVLPALTAAMDAGREGSERVRAHAAAASINFCEHADDAVLAPHLQEMLRHLSVLMQSGNRKASEQAITTVAAISLAVGELFIPYYASFIPFLKSILAMPPDQAGPRLRGKTMECISLIGLSVGADHFREDAKETMKLIVSTLDHVASATEPSSENEDTEASYMHQACGRICKCLGEEFVAYLPALLPSLLRSASLAPDVKLADADNAEELEEMETVQVGDELMGVRTWVLEEKATACHMLNTYLTELGPAFFPYLEQVGNVLKPLLTFWYHEDIRASAITAMQSMCKCAAASVKQQQSTAAAFGAGGGTMTAAGDTRVVKSVLDFVFSDLLGALTTEGEVVLQAQCARAIGGCVEACGGGCLSPEQLDQMTKAFQQIMEDSDQRIERIATEHDLEAEEEEDEDEDDLDQEAIDAEDDLIEQIIYAIGKVWQAEGDGFSEYLDQLLAWFITKLAPTANERALSFQQRLGLAMLDDVVEIAGTRSQKYIPSFMQHMLHYSRSVLSEEVRQAALYGVGLCAEHGGAAFTPFVHEAVETMLTAMRAPDARDEEKESATDNAVSSLGKIAQSHSLSNAAEAWDAWLGYLPLKADVAESVLVTKQLCALIRANNAHILGVNNANLPRIIAIFAEVLETEVVDDECTKQIKEMLEAVQQGAPAQLETASRSLPPEALQKLQRCLTGAPSPGPAGSAQ